MVPFFPHSQAKRLLAATDLGFDSAQENQRH